MPAPTMNSATEPTTAKTVRCPVTSAAMKQLAPAIAAALAIRRPLRSVTRRDSRLASIPPTATPTIRIR